MRKLALVLALVSGAAPAFSQTLSFDLPRLTWPSETVISTSTKGCVVAVDTASAEETTACK